MARTTRFPEAINIPVTTDMKRRLKSAASKQKKDVTGLVREMLQRALDEDAAVDGLDVVTSTVRRTVRSELKITENRLAKIAAKAAHAAAVYERCRGEGSGAP
ncbi:hypothetical protein GTO91_16010 [Heliobacterium undosum]|uniref:Uncharacterized protein n=1 Tax=Heliomicrobium undosum TaxID=121734 RepID=A0A845L4I8_9FIRM|nr:hypothetical protein [Heliomicrobium undosum]MZP31213.1 hypothetical protein [Heliomicrobium undosum]